jgi:hypothetical protein
LLTSFSSRIIESFQSNNIFFFLCVLCARLSNKERKELQRLEKEQAESQGGSGKLGKVKTKKGGKEEAPPSASQRVVGI